MTSDDQQFLDMLASIPQDMAQYGGRIADFIEKQSSNLAAEIRDALHSATWIPDAIRPPRSESTHFFSRPLPPPQSFVEKATAWVSENRTIIAVGFAFVGTTAILIHWRKRAHARKRRAKKFASGAKKEIVVLACSDFHDQLTRSLALDLERRGYIVYTTISSTEEESLVYAEAKPDIRPLWMDLTSSVPNPTVDIHPNLEPVRDLLMRSSGSSSPGSAKATNSSSSQQQYTFAGLVILPGSSGYPTGPFLMLQPTDLVDTINTRLLSPVLTVQQFLPLLTHYNNSTFCPSIILAYPSIPLSLSPPYQTPELLTTASLSAFASSLRREIRTSSANINVTELRLGNFDLGSTYGRSVDRSADAIDLESQTSVLTTSTHWHSSQRAAQRRSSLGQSSVIKGSAVREFHNAVFDALAPPVVFKAFGVVSWGGGNRGRKARTVYVGSGARLYDVVGRVIPEGLVGWMMGYRSGQEQPTPQEQGGLKKGPERWGMNSASSESGVWEKL